MKDPLGGRPHPSVSLVVPAFNEGQRIAGVLAPLATTEWLAQRIVVDDGSTDETGRVAARYPGVEVLRHRHNLGKGAAVQSGLARATGEIVVLLDADLLGLEPRHVAALARPLLAHEELAMTIGQFVNGRLSTDMSQAFVPILNGQRGLKRRFIERLPDLSDLRYGVETFLSRYARRIGEHVRTVKLPGLAQVLKEEKVDRLNKAAQERITMYIDAVNGWNRASATKL